MKSLFLIIILINLSLHSDDLITRTRLISSKLDIVPETDERRKNYATIYYYEQNERKVGLYIKKELLTELNNNVPYNIRLIETKEQLFDNHFYWSSTIVLITKSDNSIVFDKSICELHKIKMKLTVVPISYGLPIINDHFETHKNRYFINGLHYILGGCTVTTTDPKHDFKYICPTCVKNKELYKPTN